eukprot:COSAG02_NODE_6430_length_3572_cov_8.968129_4_plen_101_part_00
MSTCTLQLSVSFPYSTYSLEPTAALALRRQSGRGCARGRSLTEALWAATIPVPRQSSPASLGAYWACLWVLSIRVWLAGAERPLSCLEPRSFLAHTAALA